MGVDAEFARMSGCMRCWSQRKQTVTTKAPSWKPCNLNVQRCGLVRGKLARANPDRSSQLRRYAGLAVCRPYCFSLIPLSCKCTVPHTSTHTVSPSLLSLESLPEHQP